MVRCRVVVRGALGVVKALYIELYVVIYGLLLLILVQSISLPLNVYRLLSQYYIPHIMLSILEIFSVLIRHTTTILLVIPLILIEVFRALLCNRLNALLLEVLVFFLVTGNLVFTIIHITLMIISIKILRTFFTKSSNKREYNSRGDAQCHMTVPARISRSQKYAMASISMGASILIYVALATIFRIDLFIFSVLIYMVMVLMGYLLNYNCVNLSLINTSALIRQAIVIGIPPYGIISCIRCRSLSD